MDECFLLECEAAKVSILVFLWSTEHPGTSTNAFINSIPQEASSGTATGWASKDTFSTYKWVLWSWLQTDALDFSFWQLINPIVPLSVDG